MSPIEPRGADVALSLAAHTDSGCAFADADTTLSITLADLVPRPQWVAWRNEMRKGKPTKVPYAGVGREAESDDPSSWLHHDAAVAVFEAIVNHTGGGVGIMLGECGDTWIAGIDFDTCRDPQSGAIEAWAQEVIDRFDSYYEVSPSGTGVKAFFQIDPAGIAALRAIMATAEHGRQFKRANGGEHPPAIELYISRRYFTVTWEGLPDSPPELRRVGLGDLRWLIEEIGPAFAGKPKGQGGAVSESVALDDSILGRLDRLAKNNRAVGSAIVGASTMRGGSRSEGAFAVGVALVRAGWPFQDMKAALHTCPATREWAAEAEREQGDRQFRRFEAAGMSTHGAERPAPDQHRRGDPREHEDVASAVLPLTPICEIPPRPWAYGHFLLFGSAGVIGALDGGGKGAIAVVMALAMITGQALLGETVWRPGPVAIVTYEDDVTEWHRRIAAACLHYDLDYETVLGNIRFIYRTGGRITFGRHGEHEVEFPDSAGIIKQLSDLGAVLLIVDPFNHAHALEDGNSNTLIARVAGEMTRIAHETNCALLVLHHLRKGANGTPDDLMGATSLRATFRSCRILARMTSELAKDMNIEDPWRHIRIAGSKENYAPPPEHGTWYRLVSVPLDNATGIYPDGDSVAVATPWTPRRAFEGMDAAILTAVFDKLRSGIYSPAKQVRKRPWAGKVLTEIGRRSDRDAGKIIAAWIESGVLVKGTQYDPDSKNEVSIITVDDAKVTNFLAEYKDIAGPPE